MCTYTYDILCLCMQWCAFWYSHFTCVINFVYLSHFFSLSPSLSPPFLSSSIQRRNDLEKEKRKFQAEITDLQEQLAAAKQRIEDLEAIKAKLEKELAQMTAK